MRYRRLGKSNLMVSEIGFGAWSIALDWWGKKFDDEEAIKLIKKAYDMGINYYQTSDIYGKGKGDKLIGMALKDMREGEVIISTLLGYDIYKNVQIGHEEIQQRFDKDFLMYALDRTVERLNRKVDLLILHNPKMDVILDDEVFRSLEEFRMENRIKHYGVGLGPAIGWREEGMIAMENRNISALLTVYNLLEQQPGRDLMEVAKNNDVGVLVRVPDASGVLTGKVDVNTVFGENDHRRFRSKEWIITSLKKINNIKHLAESKGMSIMELSMRFILTNEAVCGILPTITSIEELEEYVAISDGKYLNSSDYKYLQDMYDKNFLIQQ